MQGPNINFEGVKGHHRIDSNRFYTPIERQRNKAYVYATDTKIKDDYKNLKIIDS